MKKLDIKRIWLITDTHLGVRNNNKGWLEIQKDYFYNVFIPFLKDNYQKGDYLFHLGDLFDNRSSINLFILNEAINIWEEIAKILPVHIILGNHDIAKKSDTKIHSLKIFKNTDNITVYSEPEILDLDDKKILLMPWRKDEVEERKCIEDNDADYLFSHCSFKGVSYSRKRVNSDYGNDIKIFSKFDRVLSGHIHYRQSVSNLTLLGTPYQLTRSDMYNTKGIHLFEPHENKLNFIENLYSPSFIELNMEDILEMKQEDYLKVIDNNFVDIHYSDKYNFIIDFESLYDFSSSAYRLEFFSNYDYDDIKNEDIDAENFNILDFFKDEIKSKDINDKIKSILENKITKIYNSIEDIK